MLKQKWIWLFFLFLPLYVYCQKSSYGIYLHYSDFTSQHLSISSSDSFINSIQANRVLALSYISVKQAHNKMKYDKDSVFAYQDRNGTSYRFIQGSEYKILNHDTTILLYEQTGLTGLKRNQESKYFFSARDHQVIYSLTFSSLKTCFQSDKSWLPLIDLYFKSEADLSHYDLLTQQYSLVKLYNQYISSHASTK